MPATNATVAIVSKHYVRRGTAYLFGPGKAEILGHIEQHGSIAEAARAMEMSSMRAWHLVKSMSCGWREPLVKTTCSGSKRGSAQITDTGREALRLYRELQTEIDAATRASARRFEALLKL